MDKPLPGCSFDPQLLQSVGCLRLLALAVVHMTLAVGGILNINTDIEIALVEFRLPKARSDLLISLASYTLNSSILSLSASD